MKNSDRFHIWTKFCLFWIEKRSFDQRSLSWTRFRVSMYSLVSNKSICSFSINLHTSMIYLTQVTTHSHWRENRWDEHKCGMNSHVFVDRWRHIRLLIMKKHQLCTETVFYSDWCLSLHRVFSSSFPAALPFWTALIIWSMIANGQLFITDTIVILNIFIIDRLMTNT